ncbi:MAG: TatD family hydrolase [Anaerolineae bacterium]
MIDTHVHLQDNQYSDDLEMVLTRASAARVSAAVVPGITVGDSREAVRLAQQHRAAPCRLYAAIGVHPTYAHLMTPEAMDELRSLAESPLVVAIGEIGLDYYWPRIKDRGWTCAEPKLQRKVLKQQLTLATELQMPVVIHDRDAHRDTLDILRAWKARDPHARGTLHAYAGGPELLDEVLQLGFYIGIDGPVTYKNATDLHAVAQQVPISRLLLETDGPYLTPAPHRGKRNEPAFLTHVAERIAELRGVAVELVQRTTHDNAVSFYDLKPDNLNTRRMV